MPVVCPFADLGCVNHHEAQMKRHFGFLTAVMILSQGCAAAGTLTRGVIASAGPARPQITDQFGAGRRERILGGSGGRRDPLHTPTNLPIPKEADPSSMFRIKAASERVAGSVYAVTGTIVLVACNLPLPNGDRSNDCDIKPRRDVLVPAVRKPVINR